MAGNKPKRGETRSDRFIVFFKSLNTNPIGTASAKNTSNAIVFIVKII